MAEDPVGHIPLLELGDLLGRQRQLGGRQGVLELPDPGGAHDGRGHARLVPPWCEGGDTRTLGGWTFRGRKYRGRKYPTHGGSGWSYG
jgi:hypothetical protein